MIADDSGTQAAHDSREFNPGSTLHLGKKWRCIRQSRRPLFFVESPLPWQPLSSPRHLVSDSEGGPVSRLADATEAIRLGMGHELLAHAREMLPDSPGGELRFLAERLSEALGDALRVAESRGRRLRPQLN